MIYVFEGADNTGKTTVSKEISNYFGYPYYSFPTEQFKKTWFESGAVKSLNHVVREHLLIADRAKLYNEIKEKNAIYGGAIIDRFVESGYAYCKSYEYQNEYMLDHERELLEIALKIIELEKKNIPFDFFNIFFRTNGNIIADRKRKYQDVYDNNERMQMIVNSIFEANKEDNWKTINVLNVQGEYRSFEKILSEVKTTIEGIDKNEKE